MSSHLAHPADTTNFSAPIPCWMARNNLPRKIIHGSRTTLVALAACLSSVDLRAEIEFVGILATKESTRFALTDTTTGRSDWVGQGERFSGYAVKSYDAKGDILLLQRDGSDLRIKLKDDAKVKASRLELTGSISLGTTDKLEIERATLLFDQENVFPLKDGTTYRITPNQLPDGTIRYRIAIERVLAPNKTERVSSPGVIALPGRPFSVQVGDLGFSFKPL